MMRPQNSVYKIVDHDDAKLSRNNFPMVLRELHEPPLSPSDSSPSRANTPNSADYTSTDCSSQPASPVGYRCDSSDNTNPPQKAHHSPYRPLFLARRYPLSKLVSPEFLVSMRGIPHCLCLPVPSTTANYFAYLIIKSKAESKAHTITESQL